MQKFSISKYTFYCRACLYRGRQYEYPEFAIDKGNLRVLQAKIDAVSKEDDILNTNKKFN
jgi:hypothetical protein